MKRKCVVCLLIGTLAMTNVLAGCGKDSETAERKRIREEIPLSFGQIWKMRLRLCRNMQRNGKKKREIK